MLSAEKAGVSPKQFIARIAEQRPQYLNGFNIQFDEWHSTDSDENHRLAKSIFLDLQRNGFIVTKPVEQFYDSKRGIFLSDRMIQGDCPKCGAPHQHGDQITKPAAHVPTPSPMEQPFTT